MYQATRLGGLWMLVGGTVALFWPPNASLLAALILLDPRNWIVCFTLSIPILLAGELSAGYPLTSALIFTTANCVEVAIALFVIDRMTNALHGFTNMRKLQVMFFAVLIVSTVDCAIGAIVYWDGPYFMSWFKWIFGDFLGCLVLTPFIVTLNEWLKWFQAESYKLVLEFMILATKHRSLSYKTDFGTAPKKGFVAQIVLKTCLPLPQTDSAYSYCLGNAKSGEAI